MPLFEIEVEGRKLEVFGFEISEQARAKYNQGISEGKEIGYKQGYDKAIEECSNKHFSMVVTGTGTNSVSFYTPFEPDIIAVVGLDYTGIDNANVNALLYLVLAPKCNGKLSGNGSAIGADENLKYLAYGDISARYSRDENGMNTIHNLAIGTAGAYASFVAGQEYIIVAGKKTEDSES